MTASLRGRGKLSYDTIRAAALLRVDGASFDRIADELELNSKKSAHWAVRRAVNEGLVKAEDLPASKVKPASRTRMAIDKARQCEKTTAYEAPPQDDPHWRDLAACQGADPELFYSPGAWTTAEARAIADDAKAICRRCPVAAACLADAMAARDEFAIRGGLTPDERQELRRTA